MRTRNEKILFVILTLIIFVAGNFYGYQWLAAKQTGLDLTLEEMKADQGDARIDLQQMDQWTQRKAWIAEHEPGLGDEGDTKAQVLQSVLKGARDNKLEIVEQSLNDVQHGPAGTRINVTVKIKGSMEGICHWLADLQKPGSFYAVSLLSLKADEDEKSMRCSLQMERYFKGGS